MTCCILNQLSFNTLLKHNTFFYFEELYHKFSTFPIYPHLHDVVLNGIVRR